MPKDTHKLNPSGIEIAAPRLIEPKPSVAVDAAVSLLLIACGVFGAEWCFISAFSLPVLNLTVILYTVLFIAVFTLTFYLKRIRYLILFILALLYATVIWYSRTVFVQGFIITTNQIMTTYARHSEYILPIYEVTAKPTQFQALCTLFLLCVIFFITGFVSWAVIRRKSFGLTFLATFPFLLASLIFTITPNFFAVLLLGLCWAALVLMHLSAERKKGFVKSHGAYRTKSNAASARSGLLMIPVVVLCFALIMAVFPQQSYQRSPKVDQLKQSLTDTITENKLFSGNKALSDSVTSVDLNNAGEIKFTGKTMLKIKTDKQYPLYLKGFTGSVFTGSSWGLLPDSDYRDINQKLNGMNVQNMSHTFLSLANRQNNAKPFGIQVKNIAASKQCIYAPYNLATTPQSITGVKFVNDAFIRSSSLFGTDEYSLYAYSMSEDEVQSSPAGLFVAMARATTNTTEDINSFSDYTNAYLATQDKFNPLKYSNQKSYYTSTLSENLLDFLEGNNKSFIKAEQDYRLFMYDKYTQLPQGTKEKVQNLMKQDSKLNGFFTPDDFSSYSYSSVRDITNAVKSYLSLNCYYTLSPGKVPKGQDFVDYFLSESHKGYCVHFATAATVMLRAMGVPARYVEGYVVTADDYKTAGSDGWASIRDSRAHAWVEVYSPGLGWQSVEMTPGFNVKKDLTQDNNPINVPPSSSAPASSVPPESKPESKAESKPAPSASAVVSSRSTPVGPGTNSDLGAAAVPVFLAIAIIVLLLAAVAVKRKIELVCRAKSFRLRNTNKAALSVYAYIASLIKFGGEISTEVSDIALKARFSQHVITVQELKTMTDFAQMLAWRNYERLPRNKQRIFKYWYNLI